MRIQSHMAPEERFFSKKFHFSYSGLNKLLFSPRLWYKHYVLEQREEKIESYLIGGKVVHSLLLDESHFDDNFVVSPTKLPGDNARGLIDKIFQQTKDEKCQGDDGSLRTCTLADRYNSILIGLKEIDLHQTLKTDQQRVDKIITDANISYWEFLQNKERKDIIDQVTLDECREDAEILRNHDRVSDLLKLNNTNKNITVYNEQKFHIDVPGFPFGLKGILDNMTVDDENKIIHVNDLKTTAKTIADFQETIEYYNYWLQAAIYYYFATSFKEGYHIEFTFIVIDKYKQVYPFLVSSKTMNTWLLKFKETLETAKWHYENKKFNLPIKFEKETVIL